jgi:PAS domain S-box-containing protein
MWKRAGRALQRAFTAPEFEDPERARIAAATLPLALGFGSILALWLPFAGRVFPEHRTFQWVAVLSVVTYFGAALLVHEGRPRLAAQALTASSFLLTTVSILSGGGTATPLAGLFALVVATAGLLLGAGWALGTCAAAGLVLAGVTWLDASGRLPAAPPLSSQQALLIQTSLVVLAALLVWFGVRAYQRSRLRLETSEARLRALTENTRDLIAEFDSQGTILYASPSHERALGFAPAALVGGSAEALIHLPDLELARGHTRAALESGSSRGRWRVRGHATVRHYEYDLGAFAAPDRSRHLVAVGRDLTQQLELQEQLERAQRLEALGRLAGGVAHDFNNYLTVVMGAVEALSEALPKGDPLAERTEEIQAAAERAAGLSRRLLAFSRRQPMQPQLLDLNELLAAMDALLRRLLPAPIQLDTVAGGGLGRVRVDRAQFEQVILNLALNARDAMPDGGTLTLETGNVFLGPEYGEHHLDAGEGRFVMLAVSDTGIGMDEDTRARAFEPFFSTKPSERGTGLGLSLVHGIVRQSGGTIEVYSEPGRGSTFKIYLPRVEGPAAPAREAAAETGALHGREKVLLVEDEEMVRRVVRRMLEKAGYQVVESADGESAVAAADDVSIDAVVTDVMLPGLGGPELAARLRVARPALPVVFISGYTANGLAARGFPADTPLVTKPFTARDLLRALRRALEAEG